MVLPLSLLADVAAALPPDVSVRQDIGGTASPTNRTRKRSVTFADDCTNDKNRRRFSPSSAAAPIESVVVDPLAAVTRPSPCPANTPAGTTNADVLPSAANEESTIRKIAHCPITPIDDIPANQRSIIVRAIRDVYGIDTPRPFQVEAINYLAFGDADGRANILYMVRKTADGKSLVQLASSVIMRGVTITLVPLVGLGSDQVEKATVVEKNVEGYHVDEHKYADAHLLRKRIDLLRDEELRNTAITFFISPQSLKNGSPWLDVVKTLARRGQLSLFVIDEAHSIEQSGRDFRPDFKEAVINMKNIIDTMPHRIPILAMSATLKKKDMKTISQCLGIDGPSAIMRGSLARRSVMFRVDVTGDPTTAMKTSTVDDLSGDSTIQEIWYSNTKTNVEGLLLEIAADILDKEATKEGGSKRWPCL